MSKQILIDYSEYLELEKAKNQVEKIKAACLDGALVREEYFDGHRLKMAVNTRVIVTADLKLAIEEIGGLKNGQEEKN